MTKKEKRFITEAHNDLYQIVADTKTSVQYLFAPSTGITPQLDSNGKLLLADKE
ncbi:hypothetical protein I6N95_07865 [Vagococcus sp. BWB3-3]|uniref:DUF6440 domain-containing protein n=1 Tax=Vagococcus allomyrinae TaxID=2794353 RepID=A0A940SRK2_9ENTE|nr:DUF6440 family protein [Vagococcus allomyrinae]MBP1040917.1 hypothetical protein [Vagococcus allomyrinae]